jgi:hypothetical protein
MENKQATQQDNKLVNDAIADLKNKEAVIIECPKCEEQTFIGVAQGYSSDGKPSPIRNCIFCDMGLKVLDTEKDVEMMMQFRNNNWDKWVLFCMEQKIQPIVRGD